MGFANRLPIFIQIFACKHTHRSQVGGRPTATYFSLLRQRNSKQKKGDHAATGLRLPNCARQKMGKLRNSPSAQTTKLSLSIFCPAQLAVSEVGVSQQQSQKQHQNNQHQRSNILLLPVVGRCFCF